ncbi:PREDICTED: pentatricopeptide repeat-containing protein 1, mitochondrial [Polistes canadensis]|uniref:pentatricopeptide repeat-containing protein 1, mitochondrial n=1 Tax=Polistes canadensis TaxID=91411 RepID=UPI000718B87C|nr:PREDICTED: pentatricopeptide repeat-containing protein 1, mitochondrial [Polistes canadensis]
MFSTKINILPVKSILGYANFSISHCKWETIIICSYNVRAYYKKSNLNKIFYSNIKFRPKNGIAILFDDRQFCTRNEPKKANIFGDIGYSKYNRAKMDTEEEKEEEFQDNIAKKPEKIKAAWRQYVTKLNHHIANGDLSSALNVLSLIKENRDKPTTFMYNLLIRAYSLHGDVKQCFSLYNKMKKAQLKPNDATYTSLINSCAELQNNSLALEKLNELRLHLHETGFPLNETHYHVLIKAYSRQNCIAEAFQIVDEMRDKRIRITEVTYNSLLNAAISDKKAGMRHALIIWHLMRKYKIKPNLITYNLFFRAMRDTNFGKCKVSDVLMPQLMDINLISNTKASRPNLLSTPPIIASLPIPIVIKNKDVECVLSLDTQLDDIFKYNRFILFGGLENVLQMMKKDNVVPNTVTASLLLDLIPNTAYIEDIFLHNMKSSNIDLDIDFYNMLIKKRSMRREYGLAKKVLEEIQRKHMLPNVMTFGVLALGCNRIKEAKELLEGLEIAGYVPNVVILGTLISNACNALDTKYVIEIMVYMIDNKIKPNDKIYILLDKYKETLSQMLLSKKIAFKKHLELKQDFEKFTVKYFKFKRMNDDDDNDNADDNINKKHVHN